MPLIPLPVAGPYDFERSTFRFRLFGDDLASRWLDDGLHRVLRSGLAVRITADGVYAWGDPDAADIAELAHLLGAPFDVEAFERAWPDVAARSPGFRPPLLADPFEMLATSVTAQQISLRAACVMRNALIGRYGRRVSHDGLEWWAFPRQDGRPRRRPGGAEAVAVEDPLDPGAGRRRPERPRPARRTTA